MSPLLLVLALLAPRLAPAEPAASPDAARPRPADTATPAADTVAVLRTAPESPASPSAVVLVTFDRPMVDTLVRLAPRMAWEDRARLAEVLVRLERRREAVRLLQPLWESVRVRGRRAVLPPGDSVSSATFPSAVRPTARLLSATLSVDSAHALVAPLVETLVGFGRSRWWNTQDLASAVEAIARVERSQRSARGRGYTVWVGDSAVLRVARSDAGVAERTLALRGLVPDGATEVPIRLQATEAGAPVFWFANVSEVPRAAPTRPDDEGISLERWYERPSDGAPVVAAAAGELVRVRLRVTVREDREFVVLDDALPAGLEAVDVELRTADTLDLASLRRRPDPERRWDARDSADETAVTDLPWWHWWSAWDHREIHDERVIFSARYLPRGRYTATYLARATTPGVFVRPPAHAEEMYNPALHGRSDGGVFTVRAPEPAPVTGGR